MSAPSSRRAKVASARNAGGLAAATGRARDGAARGSPASGWGETDDRTFVGTFQAIDRAIINAWFLPVFVGALLITGLAAGVHLDEGSVLPWAAAALVLYLLVVAITIRVNVPLNDAIKAAGDPDQIDDLAGVRERFDERRWTRWNLVRAIASTIALGCIAWALVQYGRTV